MIIGTSGEPRSVSSRVTRGLTAHGSSSRAGFTLLEIVLAVSIGLVLLYGLYLAMDFQIMQAQAGRELVEQGTVARGIFSRLSSDIASTLRPVDPREAPDSSSSSGSTGDQGSSASGTTSTDSTTASASDTSSTSQSATTTTTTVAPFNIGIAGGSDWLILTVGRVPRELSIYQADPEKAELVSDLRRIMYWKATGDKGLARYHGTRVTASDLPAGPEEVPEEETKYLAGEVVKVVFEYFDGANWAESWDSNAPGEDGVTPLGPPAAIRITLTLRRGQPDGDGRFSTDDFSHVVAVSTANNLMAPTSP